MTGPAWRGEVVLAWPNTERWDEDRWSGMERRFDERNITEAEVICAVKKIAERGDEWAPGWGVIYRMAMDRCGARNRLALARQREHMEAVRRADGD